MFERHVFDSMPVHFLLGCGELRRGFPRNPCTDLAGMLIRLSKLELFQNLPDLAVVDRRQIRDALLVQFVHNLFQNGLGYFERLLKLEVLKPLRQGHTGKRVRPWTGLG